MLWKSAKYRVLLYQWRSNPKRATYSTGGLEATCRTLRAIVEDNNQPTVFPAVEEARKTAMRKPMTRKNPYAESISRPAGDVSGTETQHTYLGTYLPR